MRSGCRGHNLRLGGLRRLGVSAEAADSDFRNDLVDDSHILGKVEVHDRAVLRVAVGLKRLRVELRCALGVRLLDSLPIGHIGDAGRNISALIRDNDLAARHVVIFVGELGDVGIDLRTELSLQNTNALADLRDIVVGFVKFGEADLKLL